MTIQPDPQQPDPPQPRPPRWFDAHTRANDADDDGYFDPDTGLFVMTQGFLERRGTCCSSKCRHCPYN